MGAEGHSDGTVGKALDVLDMVANHGRPVRFIDLLAQSPYPKATLYRLLQTLANQGMLHHEPDQGTYALGVRLVRLAHSAWAQSSLAPLARPLVDALAQQTGETVHVAQLDRGQVLYVDKRSAIQSIEMFSQAGRVGPAYCTGVGKAMMAYLSADALQRALTAQSFHPHTAHTLTSTDALLAELEQIRQDGHAFDREEHEPGIICCAVPILARSGSVLGGLSLTAHTARKSLNDLAEHASELKRIAAEIARNAENWRFPERNTEETNQ
ncbi:IclR family transcriptional regulator [Paracoccus sp. Z330]|uniref:IclR family transcriptional regulator n=1 Tax=Paracoccus onchidii TaxID=3017813 RepID=A0ABT4ZG57_9RHOB|nr:IclR family transcriptional regulator [Paracoccus onchidii]MDB6178323.1 IclR family transcriptional regulator [Paracoccus onchidii]